LPIVAVTSSESGEGKTGIAAAIARHFAYQGRSVRLLRLSPEASNAGADAAYFATLPFVPGSPAVPVAATDVKDPEAEALLVVECMPEEAASIAGARFVLVCRGAVPQAMPSGLRPAVLVVTDVPAGAAPKAAESLPLVVVREDRTLAGFSVEEARQLLNAEVLVAGEPARATCDHLVIAPIASDAGQPYFRRFATKAVVVRFDKTDQHLAAMKGDPECLILTGGRMPSGYLFDAASAQGVPVLLSRNDTENTVIALEGVFDRTRFQGERKLERMCQMLEGSGLFETLE
jgi:NAD(P)-dependent dehydrogenase (short-subunit alcohol dehydrogenase family)